MVFLAVSAVDADSEHLEVYILTGQSNSLGTTNLEGSDFEPGVHPADSQTALFWSNVSTASSDPKHIVLYGDSGGVFSTLQMQQGDGVSPNFWGPEFGFARTFFDSGARNVAIVKLSRGGGGNSFWLPATGHMHNHLLASTSASATAQIDLALNAAQSAGHTFEVKGFMYLQGESNNAIEAGEADVRLQSLVTDVRSHINANYSNAAESMYTVVAEPAASQSTANRVTTAHLQGELGDNREDIAFFRTRDLSLKSDAIHFGRNAKLEIGRRFADAFNSQSWVEAPHRLGGYSASEGSVNAIPHPIAQGLIETGAQVPGVTMQEINDGGTPAWRILDNSRNANPGYRDTLGAVDFQEMFSQGWVLTATAKVVRGGGLVLWGVDTANDPGWGVAGTNGNLNGFKLQRVNGDELEVALWSGATPVNLGPGSADHYHTLELRGAAESSLFDFYIDGELQSADLDLTSGEGLAGFQNSLVFNSGSVGGTGLDVYWSEVSLHVVPEPSSCWLGATSFILAMLIHKLATRKSL